jgi:hypothetical protein
MSVRSISKKKIKAKKVFSRKLRGGFDAAPSDNWGNFLFYVRNELSAKDIIDKVKSYTRSNFKGVSKKNICAAPDPFIAFRSGLAATIHWKEEGRSFPSSWDFNKALKKGFFELNQIGEKTLKEGKKVVLRSGPSPAEIIKRKTEKFISELESRIDGHNPGSLPEHKSAMEFSLFDELLKHDASQQMANAVLNYYKPIATEYAFLVSTDDKEMQAGFSNMTKPIHRKRRAEYFAALVSDAEKFVLSKQAVRKPRMVKVKSVGQQTKTLKYLKSSVEFKVTSIDPSHILQNKRVYLFNTKNRMLTILSTDDKFEIRGTTIQGVNPEESMSIRLRKPEEFLSVILKNAYPRVLKEIGSLTTKPQVPNGRTNDQTIILKVSLK